MKKLKFLPKIILKNQANKIKILTKIKKQKKLQQKLLVNYIYAIMNQLLMNNFI